MAITNVSVAQLMGFMQKNLNMILVGPAGVGKTLKLLEAAETLGLAIKMLPAPTIDPYAHLVGIPVPNLEHTQIQWLRSEDFDEVEVLFLDEINRAEDATLNALFEVIQFGSINGKKLPKLKCVVAAMNPAEEGYHVNEIDTALWDRFNIYVDVKPHIDKQFFKKRYGEAVATLVATEWGQYETNRATAKNKMHNKVPYLSPRKMQSIVDSYIAIPQRSTLQAAIPPGVTLSVGDLHRKLQAALNTTPPSRSSEKKVSKVDEVSRLQNVSLTELRKSSGVIETLFDDALNESTIDTLQDLVVKACESHIGVGRLTSDWKPNLIQLDGDHIEALSNMWQNQKFRQVASQINSPNWDRIAR